MVVAELVGTDGDRVAVAAQVPWSLDALALRALSVVTSYCIVHACWRWGGRSCVYVGGCCREGEEAFVLVPRCVALVKKLLEAFLHWEYSGQGCRNITLSAGDVKNPLTGSSPPSPPPTPPPSTRLSKVEAVNTARALPFMQS